MIASFRNEPAARACATRYTSSWRSSTGTVSWSSGLQARAPLPIHAARARSGVSAYAARRPSCLCHLAGATKARGRTQGRQSPGPAPRRQAAAKRAPAGTAHVASGGRRFAHAPRLERVAPVRASWPRSRIRAKRSQVSGTTSLFCAHERARGKSLAHLHTDAVSTLGLVRVLGKRSRPLTAWRAMP